MFQRRVSNHKIHNSQILTKRKKRSKMEIKVPMNQRKTRKKTTNQKRIRKKMTYQKKSRKRRANHAFHFSIKSRMTLKINTQNYHKIQRVNRKRMQMLQMMEIQTKTLSK
jgi:hypothetical protein